ARVSGRSLRRVLRPLTRADSPEIDRMLKTRRQVIMVLLLVITTSVAAYIWSQAIDDLDGKPTYSKIEDGLYLGGSVKKPPPGTKAVLNLCEAEDSYHAEIHSWEPIPDAAPAPSLKWLRKRVEFVDEQQRANRQTYVHCHGGISRAPMVVTAYYMYKNKWSRDEALAFVRSKRDIIGPNPAFMDLLLEWEKELKRE
ncbi:MAG: dual specificity protein phosphatase family protein, partial [Planctomycetes bacterium]|nr:dual specificity protein phosphatase family protein [Planctomycetota bacterium]